MFATLVLDITRIYCRIWIQMLELPFMHPQSSK